MFFFFFSGSCTAASLVAGRGCTVRLPQQTPVRARRMTRALRSSRPNSRSTGWPSTKSSPLGTSLLRGHPGRIPFSFWRQLHLFGSAVRHARRYARRRVSVQRCKPCANPTTVVTCRSICQRGWRNIYMCSTTSPRKSPCTTSPRTTFRLLFNDSKSGGEDNRTASISSWSRWGHRGEVRVALDRTLSTVLGTGNGPSAL